VDDWPDPAVDDERGGGGREGGRELEKKSTNTDAAVVTKANILVDDRADLIVGDECGAQVAFDLINALLRPVCAHVREREDGRESEWERGRERGKGRWREGRRGMGRGMETERERKRRKVAAG
jgi:hypothetical protein